MKKVLFVVNSLDEAPRAGLAEKYLGGVEVSVAEKLPENRAAYDLIVLWSYRQIIPDLAQNSNIVVFHSSDLPQGKGWSPIFYTIAEGLEYYTVTGILASDKVDSGDVIVKARFKMRDNYSAEFLRVWDHDISFLLVKQMLEKFNGVKICGKVQEGESSYRKRRRPEDNEILPDTPVSQALAMLRACERRHPAFVVRNGVRYNLHLEVVPPPEFPADLEIEFACDKAHHS